MRQAANCCRAVVVWIHVTVVFNVIHYEMKRENIMIEIEPLWLSENVEETRGNVKGNRKKII